MTISYIIYIQKRIQQFRMQNIKRFNSLPNLKISGEQKNPEHFIKSYSEQSLVIQGVNNLEQQREQKIIQNSLKNHKYQQQYQQQQDKIQIKEQKVVRKYSIIFKSQESSQSSEISSNARSLDQNQYELKPRQVEIAQMSDQFVQIEEILENQQIVQIENIQNQIECEVCYSFFQEQQDNKAFSCQHLFCKKCLKSYSEQLLKNHKIIVCPNCGAKINPESKLFLGLTQQQQKKYQRIQFQNKILTETKHKLCPNKQCEGKGYLQENQKNTAGKCINCKKKYCLKCMMLEHKGNCQKMHVQFLNDNYKYQKCSACGHVIERKQGCPHMTCQCGNQFCYGCGVKWSYGHSCWKNRIGNKKSIFQKIQKLLGCLRSQEQNNCEKIVNILLYYMLYGCILFFWFIFCFIEAVFIFSLSFCLCMIFGYFAIMCSIGNKARYNWVARLGCFCAIIFLPLVYTIGGIVCFVILAKQKTNTFVIDPFITGQISPVFKLRFS